MYWYIYLYIWEFLIVINSHKWLEKMSITEVKHKIPLTYILINYYEIKLCHYRSLQITKTFSIPYK